MTAIDPRVRRLAIGAWLLFGTGAAVQAWFTWFGPGSDTLAALAAPGPGSNPQVTAVAVILAWAAFGVALAQLTSPSITAPRAAAVLAYTMVALVYINVMRERTYYGDFDNYFSAALSLREGSTLPQRYLYPPFWASILAPLTSLGEPWVFAFAWLLNLCSTVGVLLLLPTVLERYGFSRPLATVAAVLFGVVNVPILRTLGYAQVNMHVLLAILLALTWYPRSRAASALALAVAAQIKISPLALALPFLLVRDFRWLAWFAASLAGIGLVPGLAYGWQPYRDVLSNLINIDQANGLTFRDASFDSFFRATTRASGVDLDVLIWPAKAVLAALCVALAATHMRRGTFVGRGVTGAGVLNAIPALLILMVMVAPLVWEHHPVLLSISYLVIATVLTPRDWPVFAFAYFFEFLMPTFDFYPWSYGRLLSPLLLLYLAWRRRHSARSEAFARANAWLVRLSDRKSPESPPLPS